MNSTGLRAREPESENHIYEECCVVHSLPRWAFVNCPTAVPLGGDSMGKALTFGHLLDGH